MNRMDNLETVFDRTDWALLAKQKQILIRFADILKDEMTKERAKHSTIAAQQDKLIDGLLNWLDAVQDAAEMDGYQVKFLTEKEPTQC